MNYATLNGVQVQRETCGRQGAQNDAVAFWQSRMTTVGNRAEPPSLVCLQQLARDVRKTWSAR